MMINHYNLQILCDHIYIFIIYTMAITKNIRPLFSVIIGSLSLINSLAQNQISHDSYDIYYEEVILGYQKIQ